MMIDSSRLRFGEPQCSNFPFSRSITLNFSDNLVTAKGDDELVGGNGPEHGPDIRVGLLEADGEPLKHRVEGEGQHREEVSKGEGLS